MNIVNEKRTSR